MAGKTLTVFIEIPAGSTVKYDAEQGRGELWLSRFLPDPLAYPENYGFLEGTRGEDGKELDVFVLTLQPLLAGSRLKTRVIGAFIAEDEKGFDPKFLCVPVSTKVDPVCGNWQDLTDIPQNRLRQLKDFFLHHKDNQEGKWVKLKQVVAKQAALKFLNNSEA